MNIGDSMKGCKPMVTQRIHSDFKHTGKLTRHVHFLMYSSTSPYTPFQWSRPRWWPAGCMRQMQLKSYYFVHHHVYCWQRSQSASWSQRMLTRCYNVTDTPPCSWMFLPIGFSIQLPMVSEMQCIITTSLLLFYGKQFYSPFVCAFYGVQAAWHANTSFLR